jgi:putative NADH-flavin reductase
MRSIVLLGASGFLGKALLCSADLFGSVKAIVRSIPTNVDVYQKTVTWIEADLMNPSSLIGVLSEGDIVINLAYIPDSDKLKNVTLIMP